MLVVPLTPEVEKSLHMIAEERGRSEVALVQELIGRLIEDAQDIRAAEMALKVPGRRWPLEVLELGLDLDS